MRIVAGRWRGRGLAAPKGTTTRPTSDRVREAVFDAAVARIGPLDGTAVLDVFAGTGAMGLEALSRGASRAVFVESDRQAAATLRANVAALGAGDIATVVEGDAAHGALDRALSHGPFGLLVLDPPYRIVRAVPLSVIERAAASLAAGALIIWEHSAATDPPAPEGWRPVRTYRYGDTAVTFLERDEEATG